MGKKGKKASGVVYSTNDDYDYDYDEQEEETLPPSEQVLHCCYEKKGRGGKEVTVIRNFIGTEDDMKDLAKLLKTKCGTGGSAKNGEIVIQGNVRDKVMEILNKEGYKTKRIGG